jgi:tetratricopeptide (TPR) repeat protein
MGTMFVFDKLKKYIGNNLSAIISFVALLFAVPVLYATQNWDDHDRSGRYTARDIGANYLKSCAPNAVIFTYGDNDSFPLWYVQDVEGVRTDVRVANLSYLQAGWYIEMMRQKAYESDPLPFTLGPEKYIEGKRDQMIVNNKVGKPVEIEKVVEFAGLDDKRAMIDYSGNGDYINYLPANKFMIDVDPVKVLANGTVKEYYKDRIVSPLIWEFTATEAYKNDLAIMDLFTGSKWDRPIYFSTTVPSSQYKGLEKFFVQEGLAYRVVPIKIDSAIQGEFGMIDTKLMYDNLMNNFKWGNASDPKVYLDENNRRMFSNYRSIFGDLAIALMNEGDTTKAIAVSQKGLDLVPASKIPNDYFSLQIAEVLLRAGMKVEAEKLLNEIINNSKGYLDFTISLDPNDRFGLDYTIAISMQSYFDVYNLVQKYKIDSLLITIETDLNRYYTALYSGNQ